MSRLTSGNRVKSIKNYFNYEKQSSIHQRAFTVIGFKLKPPRLNTTSMAEKEMCFMLLPNRRVQRSEGSDCLTLPLPQPLCGRIVAHHTAEATGLKTQLWPTYSAWHSFSASHVTLSPLIYVSPLKGQLGFLLKQWCMSFLSLLPAADSGQLSP